MAPSKDEVRLVVTDGEGRARTGGVLSCDKTARFAQGAQLDVDLAAFDLKRASAHAAACNAEGMRAPAQADITAQQELPGQHDQHHRPVVGGVEIDEQEVVEQQHDANRNQDQSPEPWCARL